MYQLCCMTANDDGFRQHFASFEDKGAALNAVNECLNRWHHDHIPRRVVVHRVGENGYRHAAPCYEAATVDWTEPTA